jgi:hypothetical protein
MQTEDFGFVGGLGDFHFGSGDVNVAFNLLEDNGTTRVPFFVAPEPATAGLLGFALAAWTLLSIVPLRKKGSVANRRNESDRLGRSCDGTGQRCSRVDISNPKSSSCAFDGIFDMR